MKKSFKYSLFAIFFFIALLLLLFSFYRNGVTNNFESKKRVLDSSWSAIFINSKERILLLTSIDSIAKNNNISTDSLSILIHNYWTNMGRYKNECSLDFVKKEFDLNREYLELLLKFKKDNLSKKAKLDSLLFQLKINDKNANIEISNYNNRTLIYNKYLSVFPNFIIAKKYGFTKKKYFTIKYGVENKDPIVKSKELPSWAKGVDTL